MGIGQKKQKPEYTACTCKQCGESFARRTIALTSLSKRFCGPSCVREYQKSRKRLRGRKRRVESAESKVVARIEVKERDGNWCLLCGRPGPGLHLHRVLYGSEGGKYVSSNTVLLCDDDHKVVHANKKVWQPRLMGYLQYPVRTGHDWLKQIV